MDGNLRVRPSAMEKTRAEKTRKDGNDPNEFCGQSFVDGSFVKVPAVCRR
jgi:hypothetical protein